MVLAVLWIRGIAAFLAGGAALFWQPGLESAQDSITSYLHLTGQVVNLVWLSLTFAWTFLAALAAHVVSGTLLFYLGSLRLRMAGSPFLTGARLMRALISTGPLSPASFFQALPLLLLIAAVLTMASLFIRQLGFDSRLVQVVDAGSDEVRDFRIVTVLPRDGIRAITDPDFVTAAEAGQWMRNGEQVIGLDIGGEVKAYPINILSRHEIVNDVVGGTPLAVTW